MFSARTEARNLHSRIPGRHSVNPTSLGRISKNRGFSLMELLLVLAIIGIVSAVAIPSYLGQRQRARVIGDAIANAKSLQLALETRKAENGIYGATGSYEWAPDGSKTSGPTLLPSFQPQGASKMNYALRIDASGLTYTLTISDPSINGGAVAFQTNQAGEELKRLH